MTQTNGTPGRWIALLFLAGAAVMIIAAMALLLANEEPQPFPKPPATTPVARKPVAEPVTIAAPQSPPPLAPVPLAKTDPLPGKRPSAPAATGTIDPKALETFLNARFPLVRACYERRLKVDPLLEGTVDLRITLSTSGRVAHIGVNRDTLKDAPMLDCVKATIRTWKFPPPTGGRVVFDKPFEFRRRS